MKRTRVAAVALAALLGAACTPGGAGDESAQDDKGPVTITFWHPLKDPSEVKAVNAVLDKFEAAYPDITVKSVAAQDADKITQSVRGGNPPDAALSFNANQVGAWCSTGAFQDLGPRIERDKVDLEQIPAAVRSYTEFRGNRCTMPLLADTFALYYNKDLLKKAGYDAPPKTMSELTEMTKKLTRKGPGGKIDVAGFVPFLGTYQSVAERFTPGYGTKWLKPDGTANFADDPGFPAMLTWQKDLVDWFGADNLIRFKAGLGDEWSAQHAFETGKIAMIVDGEWRTSFIKNNGDKVNYATAPMPVADDKPDLYGSGAIGGNVVGIPRGAEHSEAGWKLVKFLSTDTDALVSFADALHNVPTTLAALKSPDLKLAKDPRFKPFLDVFAHPSSSSLPASGDAGAYLTNFGLFADKWQKGKVSDLDAGLRELARENDAALKLGS